MSFQNSDLFAIIIITSIIVLVIGIVMPFFIVIYFRKKRLHLEEKIKMNEQFESEVEKTSVTVREQTMQIIAADLHDNMGQLLSLTTITLNSINLAELRESEEKLALSLSLVTKSIAELRGLAKFFHGEQVIEISLGQAIERELDWIRKIDRYKLSVKNKILTLPISSSTKDHIILQLFKEILHNIIKHAEAKKIEISISIAKQILHLTIKDNGVGFDYSEIIRQKNGIGLHSLQNRIEKLTGKIKIDSKPLEGTIITIEIPYP